MNLISTALTGESSSSVQDTLASLFEPVAGPLERTRQLYGESVLKTAERNYLHRILFGNAISYFPGEISVPEADRAAKHLLQSDGKWIRAALVLLSAKAGKTEGLPVMQVGAAVEMIHLATLIHDDIIDEAPMRRGIQSIPGGWGNSVAVLLGDFLFTKAFKLLLDSENVSVQSMLIHATGQMCLGEIRQLQYTRESSVSEKEYLETIESKTASLMAAACACGGELAGLDKKNVERLHGYGHSLGMAFQIADDLLDYTSSSVILGKECGGDLRNGNATLPLIHLLGNDGSNVKSIVESNDSLEKKTKDLLELMNGMGSIDYARSVGQRYGDAAKYNLRELEKSIGSSASLTSLSDLVDFVLDRER